MSGWNDSSEAPAFVGTDLTPAGFLDRGVAVSACSSVGRTGCAAFASVMGRLGWVRCLTGRPDVRVLLLVMATKGSRGVDD